MDSLLTYMENGHAEDATLKVGVHRAGTGQQRRLLQPQIVAIVPVYQAQLTRSRGHCLIVVDAKSLATWSSDDNRSHWFLESHAGRRAGQMSGAPVEDEETQAMGQTTFVYARRQLLRFVEYQIDALDGALQIRFDVLEEEFRVIEYDGLVVELVQTLHKVVHLNAVIILTVHTQQPRAGQRQNGQLTWSQSIDYLRKGYNDIKMH